MPQKRLLFQHVLMIALIVLILCGKTAAAGEALRILSFSVSEAPAVATQSSAAAKQPVWRTTFGSERVSEDKRPAPVFGIEADVVLLQNVTDLQPLRRAFPPNFWRIVVSRQKVLSDDPVDPRSFEAISKHPATAVAIRYQPGVRVAGQEHLMELAARASLSEAAKQAGALELSQAPLTAATAVRLNIGGRYVWVVSVALDESCAIPGPTCPQRARLDDWTGQRHKSGDAVINGGLLREPGSLSRDCPAQSIVIHPARDGAPRLSSEAIKRDGLGCAAYADAGG